MFPLPLPLLFVSLRSIFFQFFRTFCEIRSFISLNAFIPCAKVSFIKN